MSDWQNQFGDDPDDDREDRPPVLTTGDMSDGDSVTFRVEAEPEVTDTDNGDALRVEATYLGADGHTFETEGGEPFEQGDRVVLLTWSKRLGRALGSVASEVDGLPGEAVTVHKRVPGDRFSTTYEAEPAEDPEADD